MDTIFLLEQLGADPHSLPPEAGLAGEARDAVWSMLEASSEAIVLEHFGAPAVFSCLIMTPDGEERDEESPDDRDEGQEDGGEDRR